MNTSQRPQASDFISCTATVHASLPNPTPISKQAELAEHGTVIKGLIRQLSPDAESSIRSLLQNNGVLQPQQINNSIGLVQQSVIETELLLESADVGINKDKNWLKEGSMERANNGIDESQASADDEWNLSM